MWLVVGGFVHCTLQWLVRDGGGGDDVTVESDDFYWGTTHGHCTGAVSQSQFRVFSRHSGGGKECHRARRRRQRWRWGHQDLLLQQGPRPDAIAAAAPAIPS